MCKSNRKAMNRNWSNQKANPALKTKAGKYDQDHDFNRGRIGIGVNTTLNSAIAINLDKTDKTLC